MVDIATGLSMAAQAIGIAKDLREIDKGLDAGEFKAKMAELYSSLADVKMALADAQEELKARNQEIERLRASFAIKETTIKKDGFSMLAFEDGTPRGDPFCPVCEQKEGRLFHIAELSGGKSKCPNCQSEFGYVPRYLWQRG
ncbi:hypothetical protein QTA58_02485 [Neorhizobium sp. CSC1952]|uniref:hypothetical protein n=1 Tax=Neorhizobium sp. CSC1952 TaxID=2978974 RepID=UPI0025A4E844|nr:hypothetical protein [Rhizobium sp. CSC1952]WJR67652.1 hypothetical protein QTA58_02485 [Rhizobium sp. CSC1952]